MFPGLVKVLYSWKISTLAHEQFETANDPLVAESTVWGPPLGWHDNGIHGGKIGDLCNQNFVAMDVDGSNVTLNGHRYKAQGMWSNATNSCAVGHAAAYVPIARR